MTIKKLHAVLLVLGLGFLVWLLWDIGIEELWRELTELGWGLAPLILSEGVGEVIHTFGWRHCLGEPHHSLPFALLFRIRMAGYAINYLTPTAALGGEVTRAALLCSYGRGPEVYSGLLIDKGCLALAHLLYVVIGAVIILWRIELPPALRAAMIFAGVLLAAGIIIFLLLQKHGKLGAIIRWLAARRIGGARLQKAAGQVTAVDEAFRAFYRDRPRDLVLSAGWHLLGLPIGILQIWLFLALLRLPDSFAVAASAWFLGLWFDLLTFAVPLNLGTLEGSRMLAFQAVGYRALPGLAFGVVLRLAQMFWAAFGLINCALLDAKPAAPPPKRPASAPSPTCRRIT